MSKDSEEVEKDREKKEKKKPKTKKKKDDEMISSAHSESKEQLSSGRTHRQERQERLRQENLAESGELIDDDGAYGMLNDRPGAYAAEPMGLAPGTPAMLSGTICVGDGTGDHDDGDENRQSNTMKSPDVPTQLETIEAVPVQAHMVVDSSKTKEELEEEIRQQAPVAKVVEPRTGIKQEVPLWCCVVGCMCCAGCLQALEACLDALLGG
jgi:hypothetical protein